MSLELLREFIVDTPKPIIGAKTIQLILFREIQDYAVFRTEDDREVNSVATPRSASISEDVRRAAFLGTKQKAVESREMERILRVAGEEALKSNLSLGLKESITLQAGCYLKDHLCLTCPRCILFGGTRTEADTEKSPNIKHRIEYGTAFSLLTFEEVETSLTFNAIDDNTQKTGQALGTRYAVRPATVFPSIVTLKSVTREELVLAVKTILSAKGYGAETRIGGDVRNTIAGIAGGWEEVITPLELTLELYDRHDDLSADAVIDILNKYKGYAGNPWKIKILKPEEVDKAVEEATAVTLDTGYLDSLYRQVREYRDLQKTKG